MKKIEWNKKTYDDKKWFLIRVIGGGLFLLAGAIFGIIALAMYNWSFTSFITDPKVDLVLLVLVVVGFVILSMKGGDEHGRFDN